MRRFSGSTHAAIQAAFQALALLAILSCGGGSTANQTPLVAPPASPTPPATPPPAPPTPPPLPPSTAPTGTALLEIFVSPAGLASNPGTLASPTTLEGAKALLQKAVRNGSGSLRVWLRGGTYSRSATFSLSSADSGTAANPVEYVAYPNETPRLVGGAVMGPSFLKPVDSTDPNWSRLDPDARARIYVADLSPGGWNFGSLGSRSNAGGQVNRATEVFADGQPLALARYPKAVAPETVNLAPASTLRVSGSISPDATGDYAYKGVDRLGRSYYQLSKAGEVWSIAASATGPEWYLSNRRDLGGVGTSAAWGTFESFAGPAGRFDQVAGAATGSAFLERTDGTSTMPGFMLIRSTDGSTQIVAPDAHLARWQAQEAAYFGMGYYPWSASHAAFSAIDAAGGTLTLGETPTYGLRMGQPFFAYNLLEELTEPGEYFLDRVRSRLYLRPTADVLPGELTLSFLQAPLVTMRNASWISWQGVVFESARDTLVDAQSCSSLGFRSCLFRNSGGWGLMLSGSANLVYGSEFTQVGKGGVWICGGDRHTLASSGSLIENCNIHHYGRLFWTYQPGIYINSITSDAFNDDCCGITVRHNAIHHAPHQAIHYQGNSHSILYNDIHHVCQWTNDAGAIYSQRDWGSQGNLIQNNLIRQGGGPLGNYVLGIYLDTCGSGTAIEGNILYRSGAVFAIQHNGGRDVDMRYNIFSGHWYGARVANYGLTMVNNSPGSSLNLLEKLNRFNYQAPPWSTTYPNVAAIPNDWNQVQGSHWLEPENSVFYGNLQQGYSPDVVRQENLYPSLAAPLSWFSQVGGNLSQVDPLFMDPGNLDFRLQPASPMYSIPGFPGIDAAKIGIQ